MGMRGPEPQFDVPIKLRVSHAQDEFLDAMAGLQGVSKAEVIRRMIDSLYPYSLVQYAKEK
jgi:hypothetical protein